MSHIIFQNFVNFPFRNLSHPEYYDLQNTYHCKLDHDNVSLGVWHIVPNSQTVKPSHSMDEHFKATLGSKEEQTVVIYLHGNTMDRAGGHRVELYKTFQSLDYHTVAVDYRGYGDSTGVPTEDDVVKDAMYIFDHIQEISPTARVYVWGHSLGTGVSTKLTRLLTEQGKIVEGLVLEAPFFNVLEEVDLHPLVKIWAFNPIMLRTMRKALNEIDLTFSSDVHITKITTKILILHAEDDWVIPYQQGVKLYEAAKANGISKNVEYVIFKSSLGCGHRNIITAPNIVDIIK